MGRPSDYSPELAVLICARMGEGESLRSICRDDAMPALSTVFRWLAGDKAFQDQYARAMDARATLLAEEILEISDDRSGDAVTDPETGAVRMDAEFVARSRLRVDSRKWLAARMSPKKYGDKVTQEISGPDGAAVQTITKIELVAAPIPEGMGEG
ncbi:terminase small subunit protein [Bradyrhizobium sp. McL0615]|uniref:terminase small subunit-like protein n=1 Tax=Bradyrhizobium sp. McL0615 TaxID=3415673 RepID=UPI003CE70B45